LTYKIEYIADDTLPSLGWLAIVDLGKKTLRIIHGRYVECRNDWLVEGIWDGDFQEGNFHKTEIFFGSGIRKDNEKFYFVTSCALMDRILYCKDQNRLMFSNSLLLLLGFTDAGLDEMHSYQSEAVSVLDNGIEGYDRKFRVLHPRIQNFYQVFYENIVFQDGKLHFELKPITSLNINSFDVYYRLLLNTLKELKNNYKSNQRHIPIQPFTTISSGYDSTAVSALVRKIGVRECFSGNRLDGFLLKSKNEKGRKLAEKLGYLVNEMSTKRSSISEDELYFLATNYLKFSKSVWSEISLHSMVKKIEGLKQAALVFTGYRGGSMWDVNLKRKYQEGLLKGFGAISGLNLTEIRLKTGFFTASIPYFYSRCIKDIVAISNSKEMENWKMGNKYDRPIARRIVEEAGVDRHLFGMQKRHITTTYLWPINKKNQLAFFQYLKREKKLGNGMSWLIISKREFLLVNSG